MPFLLFVTLCNVWTGTTASCSLLCPSNVSAATDGSGSTGSLAHRPCRIFASNGVKIDILDSGGSPVPMVYSDLERFTRPRRELVPSTPASPTMRT
ncbi:hypothetical protein DAEQUDRAFT_728561 [Daedalea quercina L-15889]|uniref:Secreted protein n=1 Tax=Daedalea quercina L-15889 TaxID=1314783 RepID=A0A165P614_9APHY|nr:hypothetical protein DAEQUDRAFT_728561 [Daedalea quercina L-15889]